MSVLVAALVLAGPVAFDKVLLKDGRMIEGTIVGESEEGLTLEISGNPVPIAARLVDKTYVENLDNYVPKDAKEKKYLAKGWVRFEGRWMSKHQRDKTLEKRNKQQDEELEQIKKDQKWTNRKKIETSRFKIESNLSERELDHWQMLLETYYKYFRDYWGIKISPKVARKKMEVYLYRTPSDFYRFTGMRRGVLGFFNWNKGELHIFYDSTDPEYSQAVLFHEFNHLLTYLIDPSFMYPIWMNEGMAEYYGSADVDERGKFVVGQQQDGRLVTLFKDRDDGRLMSIEELMLTEQRAFTARHYAYAWSFCHYLMQNADYSKRFRGFFGNLPNNRDLPQTKATFDRNQAPKDVVDLSDAMRAFEKRLGKSVVELEAEWLDWLDQGYQTLRPRAYLTAARFELMTSKGDDSRVKKAVEYLEKAVELECEDPEAYRMLAEMLRKGGLDEEKKKSSAIEKDPERAWELIQRAIELDPLNPLYWLEAGGILVMDSSIIDPDKAFDHAETGNALGKGNVSVKGLYEELAATIEEARDTLKRRTERAEALAAADNRLWSVQPAYIDGEEAPDQIQDLSTDQLRSLIKAGAVKPGDWIFQGYQEEDPKTGELVPGDNKWDTEWVELKDIPIFADDLPQD